MIEIAMSGAQITMEKIKQFMASPIGVFLYALVTGIAGIMILLGFVSMILSPSILPLALPAIVAFNGAAGGYSLVEKRETAFPFPKVSLIAIAAMLSLAGCSGLILFCPWEPLLDGNRYLITGLTTLTMAFVGAWIAKKSKSLAP
ncbi:MAG: hypothetical protein GY702_16515 [Desulfobulbaceae bacterium]|nr:hypothetical protein [Desulfobulbaceae bacterium]